MPVQRTYGADGYIERDGDRMSAWIWGEPKPKNIAQQIDERLVAEIQDDNGMPRVIALLEEIRDRLAGVRPTIHVPTADECLRFGGKEVR